MKDTQTNIEYEQEQLLLLWEYLDNKTDNIGIKRQLYDYITKYYVNRKVLKRQSDSMEDFLLQTIPEGFIVNSDTKEYKVGFIEGMHKIANFK